MTRPVIITCALTGDSDTRDRSPHVPITPAQIAEKYMSLARDALSSGDPVLAENYMQHAEHYNRIIAAAQAQMPQQFQQQNRDEMDDDLDEDRDETAAASAPARRR